MFTTPAALLARRYDPPRRYRDNHDFHPPSPSSQDVTLLSYSEGAGSSSASSLSRAATEPPVELPPRDTATTAAPATTAQTNPSTRRTSLARVAGEARRPSASIAAADRTLSTRPAQPTPLSSSLPVLSSSIVQQPTRQPHRPRRAHSSSGSGNHSTPALGHHQSSQHPSHVSPANASPADATAASPLPSNPHSTARHHANVLAAGLRGLQTYMGLMFPASAASGMSLHTSPYDGTAALRHHPYRGPASPLPTDAYPVRAVPRTNSHLEPVRERSRRRRVPLSGIPIEEQRTLLRRLRYQKLPPLTLPALREGDGVQKQEEVVETGSPFSYPVSTSAFLASPSTHPPPLSARLPKNDEDAAASADGALQSSVLTLDMAESDTVPFPAVSQSCSVCLRHFQSEEEVAKLPCGHLYHFPCIIRWLLQQGSCPCCRADVRQPAEEKKERKKRH